MNYVRGYSVTESCRMILKKLMKFTETGWMKTGDLAIIDDSGYGNIVVN